MFDLKTFKTQEFKNDKHTVIQEIDVFGSKASSFRLSIQLWYKIFYNEFSRLFNGEGATTRNISDILVRSLLVANETVKDMQKTKYYPPDEMFVNARVKSLDKNSIVGKVIIEIEFELQEGIVYLAFEQ